MTITIRQGRRYGSELIVFQYIHYGELRICSAFSQVSYLRKSNGSRLNVFAPIQDLSAISKSGSEALALVAGVQNDLEVAGDQIMGDEYTDHVIEVGVPKPPLTNEN